MLDKTLFDHLVRNRLFAPINVSASGDTVVIPAVAGARFVVLGYVLAAAAAVDVTFLSGSTPLTGPFPIPEAGAGLDPGLNVVGHMRTERGEALGLRLSGAVAVGGHLVYVKE